MASNIGKSPVSLSTASVGQLIRAARLAAGLSHRSLAHLCEVSATQLQRIEAAQGEYSVEKLFRVCVSLGLPITDVIDYATNDGADHPSLDLSSDETVEAVMHWAKAGGQSIDKTRKKIEEFALLLYRLLARALVSSRPTFNRSSKSCPSALCRESLDLVAAQIAEFSNLERLAALRSLQQDPLAKLKSLGLFSEAILRDVVSMSKVVLPAQTLPASIVRTLVAGRIAETRK